MPTPQLYPYKLRVQFTAEEERGLKAAAAARKRAITDIIRGYVDAGLEADGFANIPAEPDKNQLTINIDDTEGTQ